MQEQFIRARDALASDMLQAQRVCADVTGLIQYAMAIRDKMLTARLVAVRAYLELRSAQVDRPMIELMQMCERAARPTEPDDDAIDLRVAAIVQDIERRAANGTLGDEL